MSRLCQQTTKTGIRCTMPAMTGRDSCYVHCNDPEIRARQSATSRIGGQRGRGYGRRKRDDPARTLRQLSTLDFVRMVDLVSHEIQRRVAAGELPEMEESELGQPAG